MKITELYIKNFGRFSEQHFYIKDGVQVIYGENEYGKSTLQAFIRAMLFGMERGRGKAAAKDDFSKYQPWENPNYYAGVMRFRCGNRNFRLERSFDRISKQVSLVCEDDGEELSVEHGDLDILLGGITPGMYDNTVSIGQFQSRPGQELAESLKNYAANYYETGGGELDLSGAISDLRERKKAVEQQCRFAREQREKKYLSMEQECTYLEKDMRKFQAQYEENQQRIRLLQQRQKENDSKETDLHPGETESASEQPEENSRGMIIGGFLGIIAGLAGLLWGIFLRDKSGVDVLLERSSAFVLLAVLLVIAGCVLFVVGIRKQAGQKKIIKETEKSSGTRTVQEKEKVQTGQPEQNGEKVWREQNDPEEQKLQWQQEQIREEWKEKKLQREKVYIVGVQCDGMCDMEKIRAAGISGATAVSEDGDTLKISTIYGEETMKKAAEHLGERTAAGLNRRVSEIFSEITEGKYPGVNISDRLEISVWDGTRRIPAYRLSRGTVEQIYFALRMAAAEMLQEEELPVILDETFAFYDDKRLQSVLKWLSQQERQVIILSCQRREMEFLRRC